MKKILFFTLAALVLVGCGSGLDETKARYYATQAAQGGYVPPEYLTAAAVYLGVTMTATPGAPEMSFNQFSYTQVAIERTQAAEDRYFEVTREAQARDYDMTQQAYNRQLEADRLAAAQAALDAREAAQRAEVTARAAAAMQTAQAEEVHAERTAQAEATAVQATAQWQATATKQNEIWVAATQEAHAQATATAARETQVVAPTHQLWTQTAVVLDQRIKEGKARDVELAVRRQEMKNGLDAYGPWAVVIFVVIISSRGFQDFLKKRIFKRDEHGKRPIIALEKKDGLTALINTDLMAAPILRVDGLGNVDQPRLTEDDFQSDITRRAQVVEAISALPTPYAKQAAPMIGGEFGHNGNGRRPVVSIRPGADMRPVLDEVDAEVLQED